MSRIRSILRVAAIVFVSCVAVGSAIALLFLAPLMAPVKTGSAAEFWSIACDVGEHRYSGYLVGLRAHVVDDGEWVAYTITSGARTHTYGVPQAAALRQFPAVVKELAAEAQRGESSDVVEGYNAWRNEEAGGLPRGPLALVARCNEARRDRAYAAGGITTVEYMVAGDVAFAQQWRRRDWYWATIVFEWMSLTGLALFAAWPAIRGGSALRWAAHLGATPLLFFLPIYFGYAA